MRIQPLFPYTVFKTRAHKRNILFTEASNYVIFLTQYFSVSNFSEWEWILKKNDQVRNLPLTATPVHME